MKLDLTWKKMFAIGFPNKHCNFLPLCPPVKMASKTVMRSVTTLGGIRTMFLPTFLPFAFRNEDNQTQRESSITCG